MFDPLRGDGEKVSTLNEVGHSYCRRIKITNCFCGNGGEFRLTDVLLKMMTEMVCCGIAVYASTHILNIQCLPRAVVPFQVTHEKQSETSEGLSIIEVTCKNKMNYERDVPFKDFGKAAMYVIEGKAFAHHCGV